MIKYSIIIPHKNSVCLLDRCLKSIPQRDDIQIIVIDDSSDDLAQLKNVAKNYSQCELILTTAKKGAGYARNIGLTHAKGEWLLFADADDFFHEGFLDILDNHLNSDFDIVFFDTDSCYSENMEPAPTRTRELSLGVSTQDLEILKWKVHVVWGKLYRRSLVIENMIMFDEVLANNDVMFVLNSNCKAEKFGIDSFVLYCSTVNLNSLCYNMSKANLDARFDVVLRHNRKLHEIGKGKYQINLFNLVLFYKGINSLLFLQQFFHYLKVSSIPMLWNDLKLSALGFYRLIFKPHDNLRKLQKSYNK